MSGQGGLMFTSRRVLPMAVCGLILAGHHFLSAQNPPLPVPPPTTIKDLPAPPAKKSHDLARMTLQQRHFYLSAQRAADWLQRANKPDGRFVYGFIPALRLPMEEDSYLCQVETACALGRAARFFGNNQSAAIARQAILTLLLETICDPRMPQLRFSAMPSAIVNRP